ncbi:MAG: hypothetical protein P8Y72_09920, partial [Anaerolineales bacterium]
MICLIIAAFLAVANLNLPADNLMFMVGDENMPWIPPVVLGVVGVVLLATGVGRSEAVEKENEEKQVVVNEEKAALNKRLES